MAASSRPMITEAERQFPVRVVPSAGFGERLNRMHAWLDDNCGANGWEITPAGRSVVNDAVALYFRDPPLAAALAARWCAPVASTAVEGFVLRIRDDEPTQRIPARPH
jgi:hypothetical protein